MVRAISRCKTSALSLFLGVSGIANGAVTQFELYPNYHTIGVSIRFDNNQPEGTTGKIWISEKIGNNWGTEQPGFVMAKVIASYYSGCVFYTKPGTWYKIHLIMQYNGSTIADITDSVQTRSEPIFPTASRVFYVSPGGAGISQNPNNPGKLDQSLINQLQAGDKVSIQTGRYFIGELDFKSSGTAAKPIVLEAASDSVFMDGSFPSPVIWTRVTQDTANKNYNMFYANLGALNTNCVVVNNSRMYPYRHLMELSLHSSIRLVDGNGNANGIFPIKQDGFFRDGRNPADGTFPWIGYNSNTYIKFYDGSDTSGKRIHVSRQSYCFGMANQHHIYFKNIHFQYFGAAKLNNRRCAIFGDNADDIVIDHCRFSFCDRAISFITNSERNTIQYCNITDDFAKLTYFQFKETGLDYQNANTNYPNFFPTQYRNIETGRIYFDRNFTGRGNVVRHNFISGGCDAITGPVSSGDSTTARHFDIYGNVFGEGSDDAFELDGNACNMRVWENEMYGAGNGISAAGPCYGPIYIFRNVMRDFRKTAYEYVVNITTLISDTIPGSPLKLNAAYCDIPGKVYFMHNTCVSGKDAYGFVLFQPQSASSWSKVVARNNIFYNNSDHFSLWVRATDSVDLDYNMYYRPKGFLARQDRPGYKEFSNFTDIQSGILGNINDANSGIEKHGLFADPVGGWLDPASNNFRLNSTATAIDKGERIDGFNTGFVGTAPDIGAFEYGVSNTSYKALPISVQVFPNPVKDKLHYSVLQAKIEKYTVEISDFTGRIFMYQENLSSSETLDITGFSNGLYTLHIYDRSNSIAIRFLVQN